MARAKMTPWRRPVYVALLLTLMIAISSNCVGMGHELQSNKELLATVEPAMYSLGNLENLIGVFVFTSMYFLMVAVLTQCSKVLKFIILCAQLAVLIGIVIMTVLIFTQHPSLKEDEAMLNNAMLGYGKDREATQMIDTTQRLLRCCGVEGFTDWEQVNTSYIADSLTYVAADKSVAAVPISCAKINETSAQFYPGGCLPSLFAYKMYFAHCLTLNASIQIIFEIIVLLLIAAIFTDFNEPAVEANAECRQVKDLPTVYILQEPPMTIDA